MSKIEWAKPDEKTKELQHILSRHSDLLDSKGVMLSANNNNEVFNEMMGGMSTFYHDKLEKNRS